jgi:hypothetical protein
MDQKFIVFLNPRVMQDAGLAIVAYDVATRVLPLAFQSKSSMQNMIQNQILTCDPITTREKSFQAAQTTLRNSHLLVRVFRAVGPTIASFLQAACLGRAVEAFSDCLEVSMTFSVTEKNLHRARTELTTRGFPNMSPAELQAAVGPSVFGYLFHRTAMFRGNANLLGMKALTTEFKLRMEAGEAKSEVFTRVTGKKWSRRDEDFALVRDAEPELVDEYLQGRFLGTCPEFAACFHLKQCLRVLGREGDFDSSCRDAMILAAVSNSKVASWDTFRVQVLRDMLEKGAEVPDSPFVVPDGGTRQTKKARRG